MLLKAGERHFVLDGELILPIGETLSFEALQQRLHPAESRIRRLSLKTPAQLMLFDCLHMGNGNLLDAPMSERRVALERFHAREGNATLLLSPASRRIEDARRWLERSGGAFVMVRASCAGGLTRRRANAQAISSAPNCGRPNSRS
ncbi:hypothetical protein [Sphingobium sp.]|uniref:ATP-dependent DNA ligase n=1 Tax=Sphingobium sp. TaxID=1912891 RepID=UPI0028BE526A|nr:hypothetical protein [Sphingobium sp.]